MNDNYVFSGFGAAFPPHRVSNADLEYLAEKGYLQGIDAARIEAKPEYQAFQAEWPDAGPVSFFVERVLGFKSRYHVAPYPAREQGPVAQEQAVELAAQAIDGALQQAGLGGADIDAWIVSSASVRGAPGIAPLVKEYFVGDDNDSVARSLQSGCGSFSLAVEMAMEMLHRQPRFRHVVVAHADVMSQFLRRQSDLVRPAVFGDGAGAVVLSRAQGRRREGVLAVRNYQDPRFMGNLGISLDGELYHKPTVIKALAVQGMCRAFREAAAEAGADVAEAAWLVPHQTGHRILDEIAGQLGVLPSRVFRELQLEYGNISGATVPAALWLLAGSGRMAPGSLILAASAGVGGEYGAFAYRVPFASPAAPARRPVLRRARALVTGATGAIGQAVCAELLAAGAQLLVAYRSETALAKLLVQLPQAAGVDVFRTDLRDVESCVRLADYARGHHGGVDFVLHLAGVSGPVAGALAVPAQTLAQIHECNYLAPVVLTQALLERRALRRMVVYFGSAAEDHQIPGSAGYVAAKRALHGWAASASGELARQGVKSLYYSLGVVAGGMSNQLSTEQVGAALSLFGQSRALQVDDVAARIVRSLHCRKVVGVQDTLEHAMVVRRDGYQL